MKTISIPLNNRWEYSLKMFDSLASNDLSGWDVRLYSEPFRGDSDRDLLKAQVRRLKPLCKSVRAVVNATRFGVYLNSFTAHDLSFQEGSKLNLFIEDDIIVSPDITKMAEWYGDHTFPESDKVVAMICHINTRIGQDPNLDPTKYARPEFLCYQKGIGTFGLVLTRKNWEEFARPTFFKDARGWDFSLSHHVRDAPDFKTVAPLYCRANHIGAVGTNCTPEHNAQYADILVHKGRVEVKAFQMIHDLSTLSKMGAVQ